MERPPSLALDEPPRTSGVGRWIASIVFHVGLGAALFAMRPKGGVTETVAISMVESKKQAKNDEPPPPPPPPPPPELQPKSRRPAAKAPVPAAEPPPTDAPSTGDAPLLDIALGNGSGGFAVAPQAAAAPAAPKAATTSKKTLTAAPAAAKPEDDCPEPPTKPKPKNVLQPTYPEAARAAGISGKVRVEVTVDESGAVKSVRIVSGLGHGLDEAALAAARGSTFGPATRCGKSVGGTFVIGMRFSL